MESAYKVRTSDVSMNTAEFVVRLTVRHSEQFLGRSVVKFLRGGVPVIKGGSVSESQEVLH